MERIIAAALFDKRTKVVIIRQGSLSHTAVEDGAEMHGVDRGDKNWDKGFYTNKGRFVDRKEAWDIAQAADQIKDSFLDEGTLFSQDLKPKAVDNTT